MVLESTYLVREGAAFRSALDIDREGVCIAVAKGGFYDLRLARTLQRAQLVRCETFSVACEAFLRERLDAVAGLRQPLAAFCAARPGLRMLEGRFAAVEQGIALHKGRSAGLRYLNAFLAQMKSSGKCVIREPDPWRPVQFGNEQKG
jgi:polar amino acid transport system substrate-binding protein